MLTGFSVAVVKSLSGQAVPPSLDAEAEEAKNIEKDFGTLMISDEGKSRYVSHNFFVRLSEEVSTPHLSTIVD
jgi:hypothetical protein